MGALVDISGLESDGGRWEHKAFVPSPLLAEMPELSSSTMLAVANARAALASLDSTAAQLPNLTLLRLPTLRREAQSTSALEGTYAPLSEVLRVDKDAPASAELREIINYEVMAQTGFGWLRDGRQVTPSMLSELQGISMSDGPLEKVSGKLRDRQVVIGTREGAPTGAPTIQRARFVPAPPGQLLEAGVGDLVEWMRKDHRALIDPVVAAAMSHYQLETLHPFRDGNGRLGRFLIVGHLQMMGVLEEPTLSVSPWFEARRAEYYDALLGVSQRVDWDKFVNVFARGLNASAFSTRSQMLELVGVQNALKDIIGASNLRANSALEVVDLAVARPTFVVKDVQRDLGISYGRANAVVQQLVELEVLDLVDPSAYKRRFFAPRVHEVILSGN